MTTVQKLSTSFALPETPPGVDRGTSLGRVLTWVEDSFRILVNRINAPDSLRFTVVYQEPGRKRAGLVVYADGTQWNPGSGEGLYVYKSTGWTLLG